jgi:hypothetical protein
LWTILFNPTDLTDLQHGKTLHKHVLLSFLII